MKIAFVTETWLPATDGVVTRLTATIGQLLAEGHEILVIAPRGNGTELDGVRVRTVASIGFRGIYGGKPWGIPNPRVGRLLREFSPDLVHVVNPVLLGIAAVWTARRNAIPLVASYHTDVAAYAGYYRLGLLRPLIWLLLRVLHNRAQVNLATSRASCAQLRAHGIRGVRLWRRGVDLDMFHPAARIAASTQPNAVYVGRIAAEKGLDRLHALSGASSPVRLTLVGSGPYRDELATRLGETVEFTGTLHGAELAAAYANADVFVFPSTTETLGLVLLEALASGLPIVAADSPASRELLSECPAARLFHADQPEHLAPLIEEVLQQETAPTIARAEAERWGWAEATVELREHYADAIRTTKRRTPHRWEQFAAFLTVGGLNAVVDVLVFNALLTLAPTSTSSTLALYNTIAVSAAIVNSYWFNSRWTFRHQGADPRRRWRRRIAFFAQALLNIAVNDAAVVLLASMFSRISGVPSWLDNNLAKLSAMAVASVASFLLMRAWIFRERTNQR